jgi:hypothetical protein
LYAGSFNAYQRQVVNAIKFYYEKVLGSALNPMNIQEQKQKIRSLKTEISYLYKSAESLRKTCDFLINKPGKLTPKKFNSMVESYQLGKEYNRLMKKTKVLLKIAITESYQ